MNIKLILAAVALASLPAFADAAQSAKTFHFSDGDLSAMIATYSKASGKRFIVDPGVRGKVSLYGQGELTLEDGFNTLAEALAVNGFSYIEEGDTFIVKSARNVQRDMIPTLTELPPVKPNHMVTYVLKLKNISAEEVNKRLRILPSKDGEMTPFEPSNSIIISDYAANINRINEIIKQLDTPEAAKWTPGPGRDHGPQEHGKPPAH